MEPIQVESELQEFIARRFAPTLGSFGPDTNLFRDGIVDSLGVLELVRFLENRFEIAIEPGDMLLENFQSISAMRNFVLRSATQRA